MSKSGPIGYEYDEFVCNNFTTTRLITELLKNVTSYIVLSIDIIMQIAVECPLFTYVEYIKDHLMKTVISVIYNICIISC